MTSNFPSFDANSSLPAASAPSYPAQLQQGAKAFEVVVDWVEEAILDGRVCVGDRLPAERDLAAQLGVGRSAVREGIRSLESRGVLRSRPGAGAQGGTIVTAVPGRALTRLLRLHVALNRFPLGDVLEARVTLERSSARLAALNATAADLAAIDGPLRDMEDPQVGIEEFNRADTAFHVAVARASRNELVTDMTTAIRESMRLPILAAFHRVDDFEGFADVLREEHRGIYEAIAAGDPELAAEVIERHIRRAYAALPMSSGLAST